MKTKHCVYVDVKITHQIKRRTDEFPDEISQPISSNLIPFRSRSKYSLRVLYFKELFSSDLIMVNGIG